MLETIRLLERILFCLIAVLFPRKPVLFGPEMTYLVGLNFPRSQQALEEAEELISVKAGTGRR